MNLTFLGHSGFLLELGNKTIVFDPFLSALKDQGAPDPNTIKADYILLSHGHADHVMDAELIAKNGHSTIISNFEVTNWFSEKGIDVIALNQGGKCELDFATIHFVSAIHSSSMPDGTYGGNPGGFVINFEEQILYFAGDTSLTMDMKLIPLIIGDVNWAILPLGDKFTMDYKGAIHAAEFVNCKKVLGCHFDTFPPIKIDHTQVNSAFQQAKIKLILPEIGNTYELK